MGNVWFILIELWLHGSSGLVTETDMSSLV